METWNLAVFLCVLLFHIPVCTGSRALRAFQTFISGETALPEFSATLMLDDVQVGYYDSVLRFVLQGVADSESADCGLIQSEIDPLFKQLHSGMKLSRFLFNYTQGILVWQRTAGCILLDNNQPGPIVVQKAINGEFTYAYNFSDNKFTYQPATFIPPDQQDYIALRLKSYYIPVCIRLLKCFLKMENDSFVRKGPEVSIFQNRHLGGARVSCLATAFSPPHINLTLLRDGQPVGDQELTEVLPNGDGTYQLRKSVEISDEELGKRRVYTCTATHTSLDEELVVSWEYEPESDTVAVVLGALLPVCLIVTAAAAAVVWRRRKLAVSEDSESLRPDDDDDDDGGGDDEDDGDDEEPTSPELLAPPHREGRAASQSNMTVLLAERVGALPDNAPRPGSVLPTVEMMA